MQHIARGIVELLLAELGSAPVGGLLLLGELDAKQLPGEILEAVAIGEGPGDPRGHLGAIDGLSHYPEIMLEHSKIEAAEMEDLEHALVGENALQLRRIIVAAELKEHGATVALRELHDTEPVAIG